MTEITYIDDFDYLPEAPYVPDDEMYLQIKKETKTKEDEISENVEHKTSFAQRVYRPLEKQKVKPYTGTLNGDPDKIVFATWSDYLSYKEAWTCMKAKKRLVVT